MTQIARCSILAALFSFIVNQTEGQNLTPSIEAALFGVNDTVIYTDTLFDPSLFPLSGGGGGGCNQVCNNPGFENGPNGQILGDAVNGFTYAGVAGSPTSQNSNSLIIPCVESANQTPVGSLLYWWNVNQDENNVVCTNESDVNCVVYSTSNWGSSVDLISSLPGNNPNQELFFESPNGVNPTAWNPCNNQNDHYLRFCTFDGLRQLLPTANCPVRFQDMNEYAEAVCYGAFNNGDALLQQGDESHLSKTF